MDHQKATEEFLDVNGGHLGRIVCTCGQRIEVGPDPHLAPSAVRSELRRQWVDHVREAD